MKTPGRVWIFFFFFLFFKKMTVIKENRTDKCVQYFMSFSISCLPVLLWGGWLRGRSLDVSLQGGTELFALFRSKSPIHAGFYILSSLGCSSSIIAFIFSFPSQFFLTVSLHFKQLNDQWHLQSTIYWKSILIKDK